MVTPACAENFSHSCNLESENKYVNKQKFYNKFSKYYAQLRKQQQAKLLYSSLLIINIRYISSFIDVLIAKDMLQLSQQHLVHKPYVKYQIQELNTL